MVPALAAESGNCGLLTRVADWVWNTLSTNTTSSVLVKMCCDRYGTIGIFFGTGNVNITSQARNSWSMD